MATSADEAAPPADPPKPRKRDVFDVVTFGAGLFAFMREVFSSTDGRWGILVMSGIMMGLGKALDVLVRVLEIVSERGHR